MKACLLDEPIPFDLGVGSSSTQSKAKQRLRKRETVPQEDAPAQLRFLSQPRDTDIRVTSEYVYDDSAGEGMTAYVVSTGANPDNPDFADMLGTTEWLWPTEELWNAYAVDEYEEPYESFTDPANHGCCVISTIAGRDFGVAKKANVVIVKTVTIQTGEGQGMFLGIYVLEAISLVIDDMHSRDEKGQSVNGKAVITFTTQIHWDPKSENDLPWINMLENAILELLELDVVVVVSSGNYKVNTLPYYAHPIFTNTGLTSQHRTRKVTQMMSMPTQHSSPQTTLESSSPAQSPLMVWNVNSRKGVPLLKYGHRAKLSSAPTT